MNMLPERRLYKMNPNDNYSSAIQAAIAQGQRASEQMHEDIIRQQEQAREDYRQSQRNKILVEQNKALEFIVEEFKKQNEELRLQNKSSEIEAKKARLISIISIISSSIISIGALIVSIISICI